LSGCWESNPVFTHPKRTYYRYTTARNEEQNDYILYSFCPNALDASFRLQPEFNYSIKTEIARIVYKLQAREISYNEKDMSRAKQTKKLKEYHLETRYIGDRIDLRELQEGLKKYKFLNHNHPLILELLEDQYAVLTRFGTVSFWNVKESLCREFLKEIVPYVETGSVLHRHVDTLKIFVGSDIEKATFEELFIDKLDSEKIKIISYVSAQSVALDRYEEEIDVHLHELGRVVANMKAGGRTRFDQSEILKQVGSVLSVKQRTVSQLSLFDKPDETWEREELERLYDRMRSEYELRDRFGILNEKIDFLSENNTILLNYLSSQRSNFLEWVVIILIIIEIALFVVELLKA
jgi:uncharacterized Rmd1/YagE family protein